MIDARPSAPHSGGLDAGEIRFRLYVAGNMPNSRRAIANLEAFCRAELPGRHHVEILDVFVVPDRAFTDHISLTPQLIVEAPEGVQRIAGDLADTQVLLAAINAAGT